MRDRQLAQHDGVEQAEDGGVGADAECQGEHRHGREAGAAPHQPEGVAEVVRQHSNECMTCAGC